MSQCTNATSDNDLIRYTCEHALLCSFGVVVVKHQQEHKEGSVKYSIV